MIDKFFGVFSIDMGIDLGTANTVVCVRDKGVLFSEPSVVAVRKGTNEVLLGGNAVGLVAKEMIGKTPGPIQAIRPLKNGVIADFDITREMLAYFIRKVHGGRRIGVNPRVIIAIPSGGTEVEKRAVINSAERAGARKVYLIEQPMASGIGAGLPIRDPQGSMICDIGGGTTEVALMSLAGIVVGQSTRVGGDAMDEAIVNHMKNAHNMLIGHNTAEAIKMAIGSAASLEKEMDMQVKGLCMVGGLPKQVTVCSEEVRGALSDPISAIVGTILAVLEKSPPELAGDLVDRGVTLAGGSCLLRGLDRIISERTGLPVRRTEDPLTCVARGTGVVLEQLDLLKAILDTGKDDY
ncbi:MAG: rod shape-determining protein [Planctomycetes bacterium]|nr:rod shape-determining protein [Planctomycetota bacterium]